jgi:TonB-linked SusC/RagA family outer membrane protein
MSKILLKRALPLLFVLLTSMAWAQERVLTGKVTSKEDGTSLPGVNVVVKGTTNGTVTDADGNYSLSIPSSGASLTFSFIGLKSEEIVIGERTSVSIQLSLDVTQLSEIVVTALGVEKEAKTIGYSVATIKNDFLTQGRVTNFAAGLSGKVSGLQINQVNNGLQPSLRIVLRGNRSFLGNNQALLVVDGVQTSPDFFQTINPNDIESTNILKGANAAALYGSEAANGVLIVTTKTGKANKAPEITFSSTTEIEKVAFLPRFQDRFGAYGGEGPGADVFVLNPYAGVAYVAYENQSYGPEFDGSNQQLGRWVFANNKKDTLRQYTPYKALPDEKYNFWNTAVNLQNDLSLSAGTTNSKFYFSMQDVSKKSSMPGDAMRRDVFRFNGETTYGIFKVSYKLNYTNLTLDETANIGNIYNSIFNVPASVPLTKFKDWRNDPFSTPEGYFNDFADNPYWLIERDRRVTTRNDFIGNLQLSVRPTKWLEIMSRTGLTYQTSRQQNTGLGTNFSPFKNPNRYQSTTGNVRPSASRNIFDERNIISDLIATANHKIGELEGTLLAGVNIQDKFYNSVSVGSSNLLDQAVLNPNYRYGNLVGGYFIEQRRKMSYYFDLSLSYKDFLFVHGSYRKDWTSVLDPKNNSFGYAGIDASFVFTDAFPSLKNSRILSSGKITASYAGTGNVSIEPYQLTPGYGSSLPFQRGSADVVAFYQPNRIVSPSILPEFTLTKEIGIDLDFWDDRAGLKGAIYQSNTTEQTVPINVSSSSGYGSALVNTGEMLNRGLEIDARITPIYTKSGFKLELKANYTHVIDNTPLSIYQPPVGESIEYLSIGNNGAFAKVGQPYPILREYDFVRSPDGKVVVDGQTGLPSKSTTLTDFGTTNPLDRLGLVLNMSYKGFTFTAVGDYRTGNFIWNDIGNNIEFGGLGYLSAQAGRQRFVFPNSVIKNADGSFSPNTDITVQDGNYNFWQSTYNTVAANYIVSAAFWKLREVSLGYAIPQSLLGKTFIKNARVSVYGRNLLMFRPSTNQWTDPEFSQDNGNGLGRTTTNQTPPTRLYGVNLTLTF